MINIIEQIAQQLNITGNPMERKIKCPGGESKLGPTTSGKRGRQERIVKISPHKGRKVEKKKRKHSLKKKKKNPN